MWALDCFAALAMTVEVDEVIIGIALASQSNSSSSVAIRATRGSSWRQRICSWLAWAPAPGQPSPSRVGTPRAAVKFPSEPPPRCCLPISRPRDAASSRTPPIEREPGGAFRKRRAVHASGDGQTAARVDRLKPEDRMRHTFALRGARDAKIDLRAGLVRDHVRTRSACNGRHVQRDASGRIDHSVEAQNLVRELDDR